MLAINALCGFGANGGASGAAYGVFYGGYNGSYTELADKYTFSTNAVSATSSLSYARSNAQGASNFEVGVAFGATAGGYVAAIERYAFSTEAFSSGTGLTTARYGIGTCASVLYAYLIGGQTSGGTSGGVEKYQFSTQSRVSLTATNANVYACGAGRDDIGILAGGYYVGGIATCRKVTYATDAMANTTSLPAAKATHAAIGNKNAGVFAAGSTSNTLAARVATTYKYTYSSDAVAASTSLAAARFFVAGTSDDTIGVFAGGQTSTYLNSTETWGFATDSIAAGTNINGSARSAIGAFSSSPGGLM